MGDGLVDPIQGGKHIMAEYGLIGARRVSDDKDRIVFGSNTFHTQTRSVTVDGRQMWTVRGDGATASMSSPIFDAAGVLLASITDDRLFGPEAERFRLTAENGRWELWDCHLGSHTFVADLADDGSMSVERADFFGVNGSHVVVMDELVVYTHCPAAPERMETDLRSIFLLADCEVTCAEGVVFGDAGFAH